MDPQAIPDTPVLLDIPDPRVPPDRRVISELPVRLDQLEMLDKLGRLDSKGITGSRELLEHPVSRGALVRSELRDRQDQPEQLVHLETKDHRDCRVVPDIPEQLETLELQVVMGRLVQREQRVLRAPRDSKVPRAAPALRASPAQKDPRALRATRARRDLLARKVRRELRARAATWGHRASLGHREPRASRGPRDHPELLDLRDCLEIPVRRDSREIVGRLDTAVQPDLLERLVLRARKASRDRRVQLEVSDSPERPATRVLLVTPDTPELPDIQDKLANSARRVRRVHRVPRVSSVLRAAPV